MTSFTKNKHCSYCGSMFSFSMPWPKICVNCNNISYINPLPVVVVLIPVLLNLPSEPNRRGVLVEKRNIEPQKGEWALPSGYIDANETWQQAAAREMQEELGVPSKPEEYSLYDVTSSANGNLLIFCRFNLQLTDMIKFNEIFEPNEEVSEVGSYYGSGDLAFPTHIEYANKFLNQLNKR